MEAVEIIGFLAGFIMIFSFLPQLIKTYQSKKSADISIFMLVLQMFCISLWMIYGFLTNSLSLTVSNFISLLIVLCVFVMKITYDKRQNKANY